MKEIDTEMELNGFLYSIWYIDAEDPQDIVATTISKSPLDNLLDEIELDTKSAEFSEIESRLIAELVALKEEDDEDFEDWQAYENHRLYEDARRAW